jgi:hypothetical protein
LEAITVQLDSIGTLSSVALIGVALLLALCSTVTVNPLKPLSF